MVVEVNLWAVVLSAVSSMVVGTIWYNNAVFGDMWRKAAKLDASKMRQAAPTALITAFVSSLVMAYVLAHVTFLSNKFFNDSFMQDALSTAFWLWLGFQAVRVIMRDTFEQRSNKLTMLTVGNDFVTIMVMALIIGWLKP